MRISFLLLVACVGSNLWVARPVGAQNATKTNPPKAAASKPVIAPRGKVRAAWDSGLAFAPYSTAQLAAADLMGNGQLCLVLPGRSSGGSLLDFKRAGRVNGGQNVVAAWKSDGTPLPDFPVEIKRKGASDIGRLGLPSVADLDNTEREEVLVSAIGTGAPNDWGSREKRFVFICDGDGQEWPIPLDAPVDPSTGVTPVVDVDGDGILDLVAGQTLTSILGANHPVKNWPMERMPRGYSPAIGDANGDGKMKTYQPEMEKYWHLPNQPEAHVLDGLDETGNNLPGWPQKINYIVFNPSIGDVTGDGKMEVCVNNGPLIHLWTWDGKPLPSTHAEGPFSSVFKNAKADGSSVVYTCTALADLDGDGQAEILAMGSNGTLYAWHGNGQGVRAPDGALVAAPGSEDANQQFVDLQASPSEPAIADLGDDGEMDIVVGSRWFTLKKDGSLLETDMSDGSGYAPSIVDLDGDGQTEIIFTQGSKIVVYDTGMKYPRLGAQWATARGNFQRTGAWIAPEKRAVAPTKTSD